MTPEMCSVDGCVGAHHARGLCNTHYCQALRTGDLPARIRIATDPVSRVLAWITEDSHGCWVSTAGLNEYGYARVAINKRRSVAAHRLMYEHHIGPVPDGLVLDHLCRNRACCNPWHLDPVTDRVNALRGVGHPALNVAKSHCVRGHAFDGDNLRMDGNRRRCRACHAERVRQYRIRDKGRAK